MMMDLDEKGMDAQEHEETVCYVLWHVILSFAFVASVFYVLMVGNENLSFVFVIFYMVKKSDAIDYLR
jgi:hypothetical protein